MAWPGGRLRVVPNRPARVRHRTRTRRQPARRASHLRRSTHRRGSGRPTAGGRPPRAPGPRPRRRPAPPPARCRRTSHAPVCGPPGSGPQPTAARCGGCCRRSPSDLGARGRRRSWLPPPRAAPERCRCSKWPSRGGCAAHASATPNAARARRLRRWTGPPGGPEAGVRCQPGTRCSWRAGRRRTAARRTAAWSRPRCRHPTQPAG